MIQFNEIPLARLVMLILMAVAIYMADIIVNRYLIRWIKNERSQRVFRIYTPIAVNIIWISFSIYAIYILALVNPFLALFISALALIIIRNSLKDFVQGTIFKIQEGDISGQMIKVDEISGEVIKMRNTKIELQLENGEIIQYPYSKLSEKVIGISASDKNFKYFTVFLSLPLSKDAESLEKQIKIHLMNIPWVATKMSPKIELFEKDHDTVKFKIKAYTHDEKFIQKIQRALDLIKIE